MADFTKSASIVKVIGAQSVKAAIEINESNIDDLIDYVNDVIVNDTSPELGGALDLNENNIIYNTSGTYVTSVEFGYLDGVTSSIQTQLTGKQDADAATAKTDEAQEWEKAQSYGVQALSISSNVLTWDVSLYPVATVSLNQNISTITVQNAAPGTTYELTLTQDATGGRTVTFPAEWQFPAKTNPTITAAANSIDILCLSVIGTTETPIIRGIISQNMG